MAILEVRETLPPKWGKKTEEAEAVLGNIEEARGHSGSWCLVFSYKSSGAAKYAADSTRKAYADSNVDIENRTIKGVHGLWVRWPNEDNQEGVARG